MQNKEEKRKRAAELVAGKRSPAAQLKHLDRNKFRAVKERAKIKKRLEKKDDDDAET